MIQREPLHLYRLQDLFFSLVILGMIAVSTLPSEGQIPVKRGDVTGDGRIDGRDALLLLRSIVGLETITDDQKELGDVYPNPGSNDRSIGDGQITEDDVRQILRYSVRLIPEAELNGNLSASTPAIYRFEPKTGSAGTRVRIEGENFIRTVPELNIVKIGGIPVSVIEATGSSIEIEIAKEAKSGLIEVITPGGEASSLDSFTVTKRVQGIVNVGNEINLTDITIVNRFEENSEIDPQGNFNVTVAQDRMSLVGAVPAGESKNTYFAFIFPEIEIDGQTGKTNMRQVPDTMEVNAVSTAKALVFLHPFFATHNVYAARWVMDKLDSLPELVEFARVIQDRYPKGADGLNDVLVGAAWETTIYALLKELPGGLVLHIGTIPTKNQSRTIDLPWPLSTSTPFSAPSRETNFANRPLADSSLSTAVRRSDMDFVDLEYLSDEEAVQVQYRVQNDYNPLEWLVTFYQVDYTDMPEGLKNPFLTARRGIRRMQTWANDTLVFLPSNLWASNISPSKAIDVVVDTPIAALSSVLGVEEPLDRLIPINDTRMGVFECRAYSGAFGNNDPRDHEIIQSIENGPNYAKMALILNISAGMLDVLGDILGDDVTSIIDESVHESILSLNSQGLRIYPLPSDEDERVQIVFTIIRTIAQEIVDNALEMPGISDEIKEEIASLLMPYSRVLGVLETISTIGELAERTAALMGYLINVYGLELSPAGPTPLESCFVQIGDPFSPTITRFTPSEGPVNSLVTLYGENFQLERQNNIVRFGNITARIVNVVSRNEMTVEVPALLTKHNEYSIRLETTAASSETTAPNQFYVTAEPIITQIEPNRGYSRTTNTNNPFNEQESTLVRIEGMNFQESRNEVPYEVFFDWRQTETIGRYDRILYAYVYEDLKGDVPVHVQNPNTGERSNEVIFHVFDKPHIASLSTDRVQEGERFEIVGENLLGAIVQIEGENAFVHQTFVNRIIAEMPGVGEEDTPLTVTVWTPSGSAQTQIVREAGLVRPTLTQLPSGGRVVVTDYAGGISQNGRLSLEEAVLFSKGDASPFLDGWDDENILYEEIWENQKLVRYDENHNPYYVYEEVKVGERGPTRLPGGPGFEYETHIKILQSEQGEEISRSLLESESLDETEDDWEEGDRFSQAPSNDTREIIVIEGEHPVHSAGFEMGVQDTITIDPKSNLQIDGSVKVPIGALTAGSIQTTGSIEIGSHSTISAATLENTQIVLKDAIGSKVTVGVILNAPDHAIDIKNGGLNVVECDAIDSPNGDGIHISDSQENKIAIHRSITRCSGNGAALQQSPSNQITVSEGIDHCNGNGVTLEDSPSATLSLFIDSCQNGIHGTDSGNMNLNTLNDLYAIQNCREDGVYLNGGGFNKLENATIRNNTGNGVHIVNGEGNIFKTLLIERNGKNGFLLEGESGGNRFTRVSALLNKQNGIELQGDGNQQNELETIVLVGNGDTGSDGHGLVLKDGASYNTLSGVQAAYNKGHAVLISGANTTGNTIENFQYNMSDEITPPFAASGDGVRVEKGACETTIRNSSLGKFTNGITIDGGVNTRIEECLIGSVIAEGDDSDRFNAGRGIVVANNAANTYINSCTLGYNTKGGILIQEMNHSDFSEENKSLQVRNCKIGTNLEKTNIRSTKKTKTGGPALEIENVKFAEFENIVTFLHDDGIKCIGNNESLHFEKTYVYFPTGKGFSFVNTQDLTMQLFSVSGAGNDGIVLSHVEEAVFLSELLPTNYFWNNSAGGNNGCGFNMEDCKNVTIQNAYISENEKDGVRAVNCDTIEVNDFWVVDSGLNGLLLDGCTNVVFNQFEIRKSSSFGISMKNSKSVELIGESRGFLVKWGFQITQNEEGSIHIDNCRDVVIGADGRGGTLSSNGTGLLITGDQTQNVQLIGCNVEGSKSEAACRIQAGQDIIIGSNNEKWGNYIEMNSNAGVLVQGADTRVRILGNEIGVPSRYANDKVTPQGNRDGIVLEQGANHILVQGNVFLLNDRHGVSIRDGAHTNSITRNIIRSNEGNGVHVEGAVTHFNHISQNSITNNTGAGIRLDGGNDQVEAPIVTKVERQQRQIVGKVNNAAPDGSIIEVYADADDEGEILIGVATLFDNKFICEGFIPKGMKYHATITHPNGNTSEFGPAVIDIKTDPFFFSDTANGNTDLYIYNDALSRPARLTNDPAPDYDPSLSADQNNVLFVAERTGNRDLWLLTLDSFNLTPVTSDPAAEYDPAWMPDGDRYLYVSEKEGNPEIYLHAISESGSSGVAVEDTELVYFQGDNDPNADRTKQTDVAGNGMGVEFINGPELLKEFHFYIASDPAPIRWKIIPYINWQAKLDNLLAEGELNITHTGWNVVHVGELQVPNQYIVMICFVEDNKPVLGLTKSGMEGRSWIQKYIASSNRWNLSKTFAQFLMIKAIAGSPAAEGPLRLTNDPGADRYPAISPDGNTIAFTSNRAGTEDVWLMNADGSNLINLTRSNGNSRQPSWSPQGTKIAFVSDRDGNPEIYVMNATGGDIVRLTQNEANDADPEWSQSGDRVMYSTDRQGKNEIESLNIYNPVPHRVTIGTTNARYPETGTFDAQALEERIPNRPMVAKTTQLRSALTPLAEGEMVLQITDAEAKPGETAEVRIQLMGVQSLGNVDMEVAYNPVILHLVDSPSIEFQTDHSLFEINPVTYPASTTPLRLNWIGAEGLTSDLSEIRLKFSIDGQTIQPDTTVTVKAAEAYTIRLEPLSVIAKDSTITILGNETTIEGWMLY